ncbi:MAG: preprotein translocase subunit SecG [Burkholderiales bacterium]|nr:preprotein translocase subunit SecG [Burkholderiales bacterium]MDP2398447.1 preprotein translocase subunit SecG [Burkholderiales bacterium]
MEVMILVVHVLLALTIIVLVLLQHGKGADMGAAFGTGSAGSVFGSSGSANFLSRTTAVLATLFFLTSIGLTIVSAKGDKNKGLMAKPLESAPSPASLPAQIPTPPPSVPASAVPVPAPAAAGDPKGGDAAGSGK